MRRTDSTYIATGEQGQQAYLPPRVGASSDGEGLWGDEPRPNSAVTAGRTIIDRSVIIKELLKGAGASDQHCPEDNGHRLCSYHTILPSMCSSVDSDSVFTASSALTPIPKADDAPRPLKSCLVSSGSLDRSARCRRRSSYSPPRCDLTPNGEFSVAAVHAIRPNVSFSRIYVREYEVTLGDNPSVSSGPPLSLGWRYDPRESVVSLEGGAGGADDDAVRPGSARRSTSEIKLSDVQRHSFLLSNPSVSTEDILETLVSTTAAKLDREETSKELFREEALRRRARMDEMEAEERKPRTRRRTTRRSGIVDGGLMISMSLASI